MQRVISFPIFIVQAISYIKGVAFLKQIKIYLFSTRLHLDLLVETIAFQFVNVHPNILLKSQSLKTSA